MTEWTAVPMEKKVLQGRYLQYELELVAERTVLVFFD